MTLEESINYINYGVKEGYFDENDFKGMSNEEIIIFANNSSEQGELRAYLEEEL